MEEPFVQIQPEASPFRREVEMRDAPDEGDERRPNSSEGSQSPSTTSSEIKRHLGPVSDPGFHNSQPKVDGKKGPGPSHLSLTMPISDYSFEILDEKATILSAPKAHFVVY